MRVWLIVIGEPLPTERRERLLRTGLFADMLSERGWDVTWWTSTFDHSHKRQRSEGDLVIQIAANYRIELIHAPGYASNISFARLSHNWATAHAASERMRGSPPPDAIWCCLPTPELAAAAADYAAAHKVPLVIDVRDLWPDIFLDVVPRPARWAVRLALLPLFAQTQRALQRATGIVAVSRSYLVWALRYAGHPAGTHDRVFPLAYREEAPDKKALVSARQALIDHGVQPNKTICCYAGAFGRTYDLGTVIEAAHTLSERGDDRAQFVLCGDGEQMPRWRAQAAGLPNVLMTGWLDSAMIAALIRMSAIGLAAYAPGAPQGLPNKPFEYFAGGLPVLSSLRGELEQILAENDCGLTYPAGNVEEFLSALTVLLDDPARRQRMAANARRLYERSFSAGVVYSQMCDYLEALARQANAG